MSELDSALAALEMGIQTEIDGYNFYTQFAARTQNAEAKEMFERLAQDEVMHLELLRNNRRMLQDSGQWPEHAVLEFPGRKGAPIFSGERVTKNIVDHTSDLSALRLAYLIEKDAVDFYRRAAGEMEDANGQRMFRDLARWEQGHLDMLESEYRSLLDHFQSAMGFTPF
ncbi:MAG: ferritin family protein [Anaerolineae bacterium]|nr:ferritin family protein [Anaerolineae bacterium]